MSHRADKQPASKKLDILRYEIRVDNTPEWMLKVEEALGRAGLLSYTCVADECGECHEEVDECLCEDGDD